MNDKILNILNSICEGWIKEYRFDSVRKFRFDYGNLKHKMAVEIEGGIWSGGGHTRGKGYIKDMRKYNLAQLRGWLVLRYTYGEEGLISDDIKRAIDKREKEKLEKEKLKKLIEKENIIEKEKVEKEKLIEKENIIEKEKVEKEKLIEKDKTAQK